MKKLHLVAVLVLCCLFFPGFSHAGKVQKGMVLIPKGCFQMGTAQVHMYDDHEKNDRERPIHKVCLSAFYLDKTEASQKTYEKIMGRNPAVLIGAELPVEHVRFHEARSFCALQGKRLPTEAEWEYATRAEGLEKNPGNLHAYAWHSGNSSRTPHPVGTKKANAWGVHDMLGSVWEWVSDWYSVTYFAKSPHNNPQGPKDRRSHHVIRGGSWVDDESQVRTGTRHPGMADATESYLVGVRCARDLKSRK